MRRIALLLVPALLAGCATHVGNPADGLGGFLGRALSFNANANRPLADSPNARRVMGAAETAEPLEAEPGNVWPGPLPPARTMSDMQRDIGSLPPIDAPAPRSSATPPPVVSLPPASVPPASAAVPRPIAPPAAGAGRVLQTPSGPAVTTIGSNGVETYTLPTGRTGIVMPNANGTLTLIGPDGTTQIIAAPR
jgi:hypothetical protein